MADQKALPTSELGRYLTFSDVSKTTDASVDTLFHWHKLILAMGFNFGQKIKGVWNFSPHELFQMNVAASLSRSGYPVSMEALRQILESTKQQGKPTASLFLTTPSTFAIIAVDVQALFDTLEHMLERVKNDV